MKAKVPEMYSREYMDERIMSLDMVALLVLHNEFGFGAERLKRYYRAIPPTAERYAKLSDGEPAYGKKDKNGMGRTELWALKRDLYKIGFDYDTIVAEENEIATRELEAARGGRKEK